MSLGDRIRFFRNLRGMTQKELGKCLGFSDNTAYVRIAQYESNSKTPRENIISDIADVLQVSTNALTAPDIDTKDGIVHALFLLEDTCAFRIDKLEGELCLRLNSDDPQFGDMYNILQMWYEEAAKYRNGEISRKDYDQWRYRYPLSEAERNAQALRALREKHMLTCKCKQIPQSGYFTVGNAYRAKRITVDNPTMINGNALNEGIAVIDDEGEMILFAADAFAAYFNEL